MSYSKVVMVFGHLGKIYTNLLLCMTFVSSFFLMVVIVLSLDSKSVFHSASKISSFT